MPGPPAIGPVLAPYRPQRAAIDRHLRTLLLLLLVACTGAVYGFLFALSPYLVLFLLGSLATLGAAVIWALPDHDHAPTGLLRRLFFGAVVVMVVWPNYVAIAVPGLPWISMQRLLLVPMCVALGVCLSMSGAFRRDMGATLAACPRMARLLAGLVVIQFLSMGMAYDHLVEAAKDLFNYQIVWIAPFFAGVYLFRDERNVGLFFAALLAGALVLLCIGQLEAINRQALWAGHIPAFLKIDAEMIDLILRGSARADAYRVQASFSTSLALAEYLAMVTPVVVHLLMSTKRVAIRIAAVALDLAIVLTILQTQSRLGLVGFIVAHAFYLGGWFLRHWRANRTSIVGPMATLAYPAAMAVTIAAILSVNAISERVLGGGAAHASTVSRGVQWERALGILVKSPLFGHGPRSGAASLDFRNAAGTLTLDSYFLSILLDYGVLGFLCFYGMVIIALVEALALGLTARRGPDSWGLAIATALLVFLTTKVVLSQEDNVPLAFMLMGMTVAMLWRRKQAG